MNLVVNGVLDDGLDRREAGAAGQHDDGLLGLFLQLKAAVGALDAQDVLFLQHVEDMLGE